MKFEYISKYRTQLMGVAVLWIAVLHASMWFPIEIINWIKLIGQGGVDIFLFLSSFGLYYAYQKRSKPLPFILNRFLRILPYYVPIAIYRCFYLNSTVQEIILMATTLTFWLTWDRSYWYVSGIFVLYIVSPFYLNKFKFNFERNTFIAMGIVFVISLFFLPTQWSIFTSRIPIFMLGFLFGKYSYERKEMNQSLKRILLVSFVVGVAILRASFVFLNEEVLWQTGLYWYPFILIVPSLCIYLSSFFDFCQRKNQVFFINELNKVGLVSFEFYLLHEIFLKAFSVIIQINQRYSAYGYVFNIIIMFITYTVAYYYQWGIKLLIGLVNRIFTKKEVDNAK